MQTPAFARVRGKRKQFDSSKDAYRWMLDQLNLMSPNCADQALEREREYQINNTNKLKKIQSITIAIGLDEADWEFKPDTSSDELRELIETQKRADDILKNF